MREREDAELYAGFTELGNDPEGCDVEFAFAAQAEVALRDQSFLSVIFPRRKSFPPFAP